MSSWHDDTKAALTAVGYARQNHAGCNNVRFHGQ